MRAGLLRDIPVFEELKKEQSPSGAMRDIYHEVYRCRAYKRKNILVADSDGINALEKFTGAKVVFQVRACPLIKEGQRVRYKDREFSLLNIDPQYDRSCILTLEKTNG